MRWRYLIACSTLLLACSRSETVSGANQPAADGAADSNAGRGATAVPLAGSSDVDPSPPVARGGAGGNAATPQRPDRDAPEAGRGTRDPDPQSPTLESVDLVAAALLGHWEHGLGGRADCPPRGHYHFAAGTVTNFLIEHDTCSGDAQVSETSGTYTLHGRELEMTLQGAGSETTYDLATPVEGVAQRVRRVTIAIAKRPATVDGPAETYLDVTAFGSSDGQRFSSTRAEQFTAPDGATMFAYEVVLQLQLDRSLRGLMPGSPVGVVLTAKLVQADLHDPRLINSAEIRIAYDAHVREGELGWRRIVAIASDREKPEQSGAGWQTILEQAGFGEHPGWAQRLLLMMFYPSHSYHPDDVMVLSSWFPESGHWVRSERAPDLPGAR